MVPPTPKELTPARRGVFAARPGAQFGVQEEWRLLQVQRGVRRLAMQARRDLLVAQRERGLDQARHAGRGIEMADVSFHGAERAELPLVGRGAKRLGQAGDLDRIAERRGGTMRFDVGDGVGCDAGAGLRERDDFRMPAHARRGEADFRGAVVVERLAFDDRVDLIAIGDRIREPLQDHDARAAGKDGAARLRIERPAPAIRRSHAAFLVEVAAILRKRERHAAGERDVAAMVEQALAGDADGDERSRASGLNVQRRPAQARACRRRDW